MSWTFFSGSVPDPYSFDTDPDPAFLDEYRSGSGAGSRMTKIEKGVQQKNNNNFGSKTTV
jgi:hypothetical protein